MLDINTKKESLFKVVKIIAYFISALLIVVGFVMPPIGVIDNSVLIASGLLMAGYQLLFGDNIWSIHIDKNGIDINKQKDKEID